MGERVLTPRELNRATLARQLLLERAPLPVPEAIARLVALQAQVPNPPYVGLWTRLPDFRRDDLTGLLERREVVRATLLRSTLHLTTAGDYLLLRPALQPVLTRALHATFGRRAQRLDVERLIAAARPWMEETPRTLGELRAFLAEIAPGEDPEALASAVARAHLPLVQVFPGGAWGAATRAYAPAESWLGGSFVAPEEALRQLVLRYLAAFGPATVKDVEQWSGLRRLEGTIAGLRPGLRAFRDERGAELLDAPDLPLPPADTPIPPRFLPEYDNLLLAHADRTRVIADAYRPAVFLSAARVRATFLVDGFVHGAWRIERARRAATLVIEPFAPLPRAARAALIAEGERLIRFVEDGAGTFDIRFAEQP